MIQRNKRKATTDSNMIIKARTGVVFVNNMFLRGVRMLPILDQNNVSAHLFVDNKCAPLSAVLLQDTHDRICLRESPQIGG